ncbi:MAG TPA: hypothetical protein VNL71_22620 [Chloroflexota bacterium]|nr:hypothetical protein [Chloroflexota bacterium]
MLGIFLWGGSPDWRRRALGGFGVSLSLWALLGILGSGKSDIYARWWYVLRHFPRTDQANQGNLRGMFEGVLSPAHAWAAAILVLPFTLPLFWRLLGDPRRPRAAWDRPCRRALCLAWIVTPFNHFWEYILLVPLALGAAFPLGVPTHCPGWSVFTLCWILVLGPIAYMGIPSGGQGLAVILGGALFLLATSPRAGNPPAPEPILPLVLDASRTANPAPTLP